MAILVTLLDFIFGSKGWKMTVIMNVTEIYQQGTYIPD